MPKRKCIECNDNFFWHPSQNKEGLWCGRKCWNIGYTKRKIETGKYTKATAMTYFKRTEKYCCRVCSISKWNKKELRLQIDHIDGNIKNNKLKNLRYLCPNCHTQTDNWGVKNMSEEGYKRIVAGGTLGNRIQNGRAARGSRLN
jgi:hypothetical protein